MYRLLLLNFVDSFIDNCILSCVDEPAYGGIVQCELLFGLAAHSGIYVGNGKMLHCGNPIGYADLSNSYWKSHMYGFARPK